MGEVITLREALPPAALAEIREALLAEAAPERALTETFAALSATFRRDGIEKLQARLPALATFIDLATDRRLSRSLWSWRERWLGWLARLEPNAFVVRLLLVPPGCAVAPHVDSTLRRRTSVNQAPRLVSVLYLDHADPGGGGHLRLQRAGLAVADIEPAPGMLVHFRGDLIHEVTSLSTDQDSRGDRPTLRASLVCEQYCFAEGVLDRLPRFSMAAPAVFEGYLRDARSRSGSDADAGGSDAVSSG